MTLSRPLALVTGASTGIITGSLAGFTPGSFQGVYHGTKAFIDSFSFALRNELKNTGVRLPNSLELKLSIS